MPSTSIVGKACKTWTTAKLSLTPCAFSQSGDWDGSRDARAFDATGLSMMLSYKQVDRLQDGIWLTCSSAKGQGAAVGQVQGVQQLPRPPYAPSVPGPHQLANRVCIPVCALQAHNAPHLQPSQTDSGAFPFDCMVGLPFLNSPGSSRCSPDSIMPPAGRLGTGSCWCIKQAPQLMEVALQGHLKSLTCSQMADGPGSWAGRAQPLP